MPSGGKADAPVVVVDVKLDAGMEVAAVLVDDADVWRLCGWPVFRRWCQNYLVRVGRRCCPRSRLRSSLFIDDLAILSQLVQMLWPRTDKIVLGVR